MGSGETMGSSFFTIDKNEDPYESLSKKGGMIMRNYVFCWYLFLALVSVDL